MKTKKDFFILLDSWHKDGPPKGVRMIGKSIAGWITKNMPGEFYGVDSRIKKPCPVKYCAIKEWYNQWYKDRILKIPQNITVPRLVELQSSPENITNLADRIKDKIYNKSGTHTIESLSDIFDTGAGKVRIAIEELKKRGFTISVDSGFVVFNSIIPKSKPTVLDVNKMSTGFYRFGVTGDNHLCSKYSRLDVLNSLYDIYHREGINVVYNTGNWIDGEARFNKHDLIVHGLDNQVKYFIDNYPQRDGIQTRYVTGDDHEGWYTQREGIDVGKYAMIKAQDSGRDDLIYLGHMEHDEILESKNGKTIIRVCHPGGGSSYATSYSVQKIVESYTGGDKPHVLLAGHYHKAEYTYVRGVSVVQSGTTMSQSPFMRKKKLAAHLGGWIIELAVDDNGAITRFKQEFIPYYDKDYYEKWGYIW